MLRDFQQTIKDDTYRAWNEGAKDVMVVSPTGSGKTVVMGSVTTDFDGQAVCAVAHRQELVSQISLAFNREEVPHGIYAPPGVIKSIIGAQIELHGRSFYSPNAPTRVAGVDMFRTNRIDSRWLDQVALALFDEGHHVTRENKWGAARNRMPNARGLLFTAHALRADGLGLGRHADGIVDRLVLGPPARGLINRGFLTDYRVVCPPLPDDLKLDDLEAGPGGELNMEVTAERVNASTQIVGDIVKHYRLFAEGELGITFAVDVKACHKIADAFNAKRIPAAIITAKTPIAERAHVMKLYRQRQIIQLINVDCLGEGTDVPACTVVSMGRPTASFQLCAQQFGRMLRILVSDELNRLWHGFSDGERLAHIARSPKPCGILIDHVGNIALGNGAGRHGLPDRPRVYSLDRREKRSRPADDAIPLTVCLNDGTAPDSPTPGVPCLEPYEKVLSACPYCGQKKPAPAGRGSPAHVEGDLFELSPEVLAQLRGEIERIDGQPFFPKGADGPTIGAIKKRHRNRQEAQASLREVMALWAGWQTHLGRPMDEQYRRFYHHFNIDAATAMTLGEREAEALEQRIQSVLNFNNIVRQSA